MPPLELLPPPECGRYLAGSPYYTQRAGKLGSELAPRQLLTLALRLSHDETYEGLAATPPAIRASEARPSSRQRTAEGNSFSKATRTSSADSSPRSSEPRSRA